MYAWAGQRSLMVEHRSDTGYIIDFSSISGLDKAAGYVDCMIKEAIEIRLNLRNFNRVGSFILIWSWYLVSNMLK
jgi:hypothetical protein